MGISDGLKCYTDAINVWKSLLLKCLDSGKIIAVPNILIIPNHGPNYIWDLTVLTF